jgi:predicted  nucleic acid-binding Zn-ribbon protein
VRRLRDRLTRSAPARQDPRLQRIEQRVEHLEALVEGLQDAVHRDSLRHEERMTEIERKTDPEILAKALSDDARRRGI